MLHCKWVGLNNSTKSVSESFHNILLTLPLNMSETCTMLLNASPDQGPYLWGVPCTIPHPSDVPNLSSSVDSKAEIGVLAPFPSSSPWFFCPSTLKCWAGNSAWTLLQCTIGAPHWTTGCATVDHSYHWPAHTLAVCCCNSSWEAKLSFAWSSEATPGHRQ